MLLNKLSIRINTDNYEQDSFGCFLIIFDDIEVNLSSKNNLIIIESTLEYHVSELPLRNVNLQQILEENILSLKKNNIVVSVSTGDELKIRQVLSPEIDFNDFYIRLNEYISMAQQVIHQLSR